MDSGPDKRMEKELRQLNKLVKLVPADRAQIARKLAGELAFMAAALDDLKTSIGENGPVEQFKQGRQEFLRENPALKAYNTTIQRYSLLYKQLTDLLPRPAPEPPENPLADFIRQGGL